MKRLFLLIAALTALVAAGAAVAHLKSSDVNAVSATLTATTVDRLQTRTVACAGGQTVEISDARYTGTATSTNPDLNGPAELRVHSVFNTNNKLGWVEGSLKVRSSDHRSSARFTAVNKSGTLDGWLSGKAGRAGVFGSLSGSFSKEAGLSGGQFGTGPGTNAALLISRIDCRAASKTRPSVFLTVRGQVDVLTTASISVKPGDDGASQACTIGDEKPSSRIAVGDRVEMTCAQVGGAWVLKKVRERN